MPKKVPVFDLEYGEEERAAVSRVLDTGWLSMGPEVAAFEQEFAQLVGIPGAVAVSSGTAALHLALCGVNVRPSRRVLQPALNFAAAANMTKALGGIPVFADIVSVEEPTVDPAHVEHLVDEATAAVVVMHYGGWACRMDELLAISQRAGVPVIEDACHATGGRYESEHIGGALGALGAVGCFSFFSNKNLATGEGGMLITGDERIATMARSLRSHGMTSMSWDRHHGHASGYDIVAHGFNYRLDEIHAALGRVQLSKLANGNQRRLSLLDHYTDRIGAIPGWTTIFPGRPRSGAVHLMVALAPDRQARDRAIEALRRARIQTSLHYPAIPDFSAFAGVAADVPRTREFAARALTLPLFPRLEQSQVDRVCAVLEQTG